MENTHNFIMPKTNLIGVGAIKDLPNELLSWKLAKALIVTDKNMIRLGWVEQVEKILKSLFIFYDIFDRVMYSNPTVSFVEDGLTYFPQPLELSRDYGLIISIGGGSNHDCAKAIAAVAANGGSIIDYEGYNKIVKPCIPHIAINTSYTGSEMTMFSIITDESRKVKMSIVSPMITPLISVNDPIFASTMPERITAASGIDILGHAIEAYVSTEASPITDSLALGAVKLVFDYLKRIYENGHDLKAREQIMYASVMAGMAFNNAGLGYNHAMGHQLGGFYNLLHGDYEGVLLPYVFEYNSTTVPENRILRLAQVMGVTTDGKLDAVEKIVTLFKKLAADIEIPQGLKSMGVQESDLNILAENALKDIAGFTNPRKGTVDDIINIYKAAM
jgi:alcohol dehydrogenase